MREKKSCRNNPELLKEMGIGAAFLFSATKIKPSEYRRLLIGIFLKGALHKGTEPGFKAFELLGKENKPGFRGLRPGFMKKEQPQISQPLAEGVHAASCEGLGIG
jgi:hypothetical protein